MGKNVERVALTVSVEQALDVQYELARATPVDTALARSNWRISIGRPLTGVIRPYKPYPSRHRPPYGPGGTKSERSNLNAVISQGRSRLSSYTKGSIYVSNAAPHIGSLDRGHSSQSSAGFVARAVLLATSRTKMKISRIFNKQMRR